MRRWYAALFDAPVAWAARSPRRTAAIPDTAARRRRHGGDRPCARTPADRPGDAGGAPAHHLRDIRTAGPVPTENPFGPGYLVPAAQRAGRRQRPGAAHQRPPPSPTAFGWTGRRCGPPTGSGRRWVCCWPAPIRRRAPARRADDVRRRHGDARYRGTADQEMTGSDEFCGSTRRRDIAARQCARRAGIRLGGGEFGAHI